jgi:hypothetical protein
MADRILADARGSINACDGDAPVNASLTRVPKTPEHHCLQVEQNQWAQSTHARVQKTVDFGCQFTQAVLVPIGQQCSREYSQTTIIETVFLPRGERGKSRCESYQWPSYWCVQRSCCNAEAVFIQRRRLRDRQGLQVPPDHRVRPGQLDRKVHRDLRGQG